MKVVKEEEIQDAEVVTEKVTYDPNKKYRWQPSDNMVISGSEFGLLLNSLRAIMGTPEAQQILLANEANKIVENILSRNVENGIIKESQD
jgi:hypothetical protein